MFKAYLGKTTLKVKLSEHPPNSEPQKNYEKHYFTLNCQFDYILTLENMYDLTVSK